MIYLKSLLAGFMALFLFVFLVFLVVFVVLALISYRTHDNSAIGWDPISLTRPFWWIVAAAIFSTGFLWELRRLTR